MGGIALGSNFSGIILRNNCFGEQQLSGTISQTTSGEAFSNNFRKLLSGIALQNSFGKPF